MLVAYQNFCNCFVYLVYYLLVMGYEVKHVTLGTDYHLIPLTPFAFRQSQLGTQLSEMEKGTKVQNFFFVRF